MHDKYNMNFLYMLFHKYERSPTAWAIAAWDMQAKCQEEGTSIEAAILVCL
jgi:hypothetical protein